VKDPAPFAPSVVDLVPVDLAAPGEDVIAGATQVRRELRREVAPHDALPDEAATRRLIAGLTEIRDVAAEVVLARLDGAVVGIAAALAPVAGDNAHLMQVDVGVVREARRRGVGRLLVAWCLDAARRRGRRSIVGASHDTVPAGEAFARALGAREGLRSRVGELDLEAQREHLFGADGIVARWVADGPVRAPRYAVDWLPHPLAEEVVEPLAALKQSMNDAPRGTLDVEDRVYTATSVRDDEASAAARGDVAWTLLARRAGDGAFAGFTDLYWNADNPRVAQQGDTAVAPEHRGHALGKWLKAAMLERLQRERPDVRVVRTGNADTNAAMLAINEALGFAVAREAIVWQVATDDLARRLEGPAEGTG
jgi:GNAT superfamily N-acetyltransferase